MKQTLRKNAGPLSSSLMGSATTGGPRCGLPDHRGQHRPPVRVPPAGLVNDGDLVGLGTEKDPLIAANDGTGTFTIPAQTVAPAGEGLPRLVTTGPAKIASSPASGRCNGSPKASEGPAQYPTESNPVRPQEDAGFLPRPDAADRAPC
jgi:hypothetical protein